jgi:hypothetical protein
MGGDRRSTGRAVGLGPVAPDQVAVPAQQRVGCYNPMASVLGGQQPGQRREDGSVRPGWAWPGDLSAQDRELMSQHEDLGVLGRLPTGQQCEPAGELTASLTPWAWRTCSTSSAAAPRRPAAAVRLHRLSGCRTGRARPPGPPPPRRRRGRLHRPADRGYSAAQRGPDLRRGDDLPGRLRPARGLGRPDHHRVQSRPRRRGWLDRRRARAWLGRRAHR